MTKRKPRPDYGKRHAKARAWIGGGQGTITTASTERCSYKRNEGVREATFGGKPKSLFCVGQARGTNQPERSDIRSSPGNAQTRAPTGAGEAAGAGRGQHLVYCPRHREPRRATSRAPYPPKSTTNHHYSAEPLSNLRDRQSRSGFRPFEQSPGIEKKGRIRAAGDRVVR